MSYTHLLSDLGNVLFKIDFDLCFQNWARATGLTAEGIKQSSKSDTQYARHERGEIHARDYHMYVCRGLGVEMSFSDFERGWNSIYGPVISETAEFYDQLRGRARLFAFTNTNPLHQEKWEQLYATDLKRFERIFSSSTMGLRKPEASAFQFILKELGVRPDQIVFVDDLLENVNAARGLGIRSVHFCDARPAIQELRNIFEVN